MMSAFRSLWPSTMVSCFFLLVAVSCTFLDVKLHCFFWSLEKCWKQLREAKNMKPLWKVKAFEKQTSWKVSVPDCVFMYINMFMLPWSWECVRHHNHTQRRTPTHTHTTKHTNNTPTHTPHTPHSEKEQTCQDLKDGELCLTRAHFRGVLGRYWRANRSWHSAQLVSLRIAGVEQFLSSKANDWRNRQHVVLDFSQTSTWARSLTLVNPWCTWQLHMWRWIVLLIVFRRGINLSIQRLNCH